MAYQQLAAEREELQKQYLLQTQLMDRLQHEEVQGKVTVEMHLKELQQTKVIMKRGKWKDWRQNASLHCILCNRGELEMNDNDLEQKHWCSFVWVFVFVVMLLATVFSLACAGFGEELSH